MIIMSECLPSKQTNKQISARTHAHIQNSFSCVCCCCCYCGSVVAGRAHTIDEQKITSFFRVSSWIRHFSHLNLFWSVHRWSKEHFVQWFVCVLSYSIYLFTLSLRSFDLHRNKTRLEWKTRRSNDKNKTVSVIFNRFETYTHELSVIDFVIVASWFSFAAQSLY